MATIAKARAMRRAMSPPEASLWVALRPLRAKGFLFRRQHPLRGYFLDFVCLDRGIIVEVDGSSHAGRGDWDHDRDAAIARLGLKTLRVQAIDVRDRIGDVIDWIARELEAAPTRLTQERQPPSPAGEGE
ncbi:endonuclease domain-containing protein [Brevundimonas aurifodinae]|uniref:DUF559 domain-containing protein n=2 Tax=Brevundimonas TaxID=41275 RepID=A0ABV1NRD3_9CAUL|nr:MAG: hypothetical protein B7Z42_07660 [Brevundimonas sp. 12-68-7]OYX35059.1 MAG: hypothetical protein B7Z01_03600 [Brevundimonas subvibrioides]